jgi:hypothetical protein
MLWAKRLELTFPAEVKDRWITVRVTAFVHGGQFVTLRGWT